MIAIPAIDLRDGACVQLVGGAYETERVRLDDPLAVARRWRDAGFRELHVVDLDAATGRGCNDTVVERLLAERDEVTVQVGGGVRSLERARALIAAGASRVVAGTRALEERGWLEDVVGALPGRVVVAVDVRDSKPAVRGWSFTIPQGAEDLVASLNDLSLAGVLVTAVDVEGRLGGPDLDLVGRVMGVSRHPVIAAGGISTLDDLHALDELGASGAVIGMALYTGNIDAAACAAAFGGVHERNRA